MVSPEGLRFGSLYLNRFLPVARLSTLRPSRVRESKQFTSRWRFIALLSPNSAQTPPPLPPPSPAPPPSHSSGKSNLIQPLQPPLRPTRSIVPKMAEESTGFGICNARNEYKNTKIKILNWVEEQVVQELLTEYKVCFLRCSRGRACVRFACKWRRGCGLMPRGEEVEDGGHESRCSG